MSSADIEFIFIGWCVEGNSDKVWTAFKAEGGYYAAWARRDKKLSFKKHDNRWKLETLANKKEYEKNYKNITDDKFLLFSMFPNFEEEVSKHLMTAALTGKIK